MLTPTSEALYLRYQRVLAARMAVSYAKSVCQESDLEWSFLYSAEQDLQRVEAQLWADFKDSLEKSEP